LAVGLRNVNVRIPSAVKRGDNALLICNYDLENETLYAVKWYRGRREFYRYTPKENPAWKIFTKRNEIDVERHLAEHLESSVLELNFVVTTHHFFKGRLKLKCSARIHNIYAQESEKLIEEDRPRILASGRSPDMNMYPFDHPSDNDLTNEQFLKTK
ncbi:beat-Ib, partial [Drosophila busckii]